MKKCCLNCGKPLHKRLVKFCSRSCAACYNNKTRNAKHSGPVSYVYKPTNEEFINIINTSKTKIEICNKLGYKLCGSDTWKLIEKRCSELLILLNLTSITDVSALTKAELFNKRSSWQSARTEFRKQAAKNFKESGKEYKCAVCGYDKHVDIAHIKAVSDFSEDTLISEISKSDNLIALCPNHHWEYDHGLLDITSYI